MLNSTALIGRVVARSISEEQGSATSTLTGVSIGPEVSDSSLSRSGGQDPDRLEIIENKDCGYVVKLRGLRRRGGER